MNDWRNLSSKGKPMVIICDVLAIIISSFFGILELLKIKERKSSFFFLIFYFLCCVPLILDYVIGFPVYSETSWYGYSISSRDPKTRIVYAIFCIIFSSIFYVFQKKTIFNKGITVLSKNENSKKNNFVTIILLAMGLAAPLIVLLFSENKTILFQFGWRYAAESSSSSFDYTGYGAAERFTYIGIVSTTILLFTHHKKITKVMSLFLVFSNICIEGKRSIILFAFFVVFVAFFFSKTIVIPKKWKPLIIALFALGLLGFVFYSYKKFRSASSLSVGYVSARVDFFRDQTIRFAIYSTLYKSEVQILSYPFESYIYQIGYLFPLTWMGVPKIGYETFLTSAIKLTPIPDLNNTRTTMCYIDEMTSNFGFFGLFLSPLFLSLLLDFLEKRNYPEQIIYSSLIIFLFMYSLDYICWFAQFAVVVSIFDDLYLKYQKKNHALMLVDFKETVL